MNRVIGWGALLLLFSATALQAQDLSGTWQGTIKSQYVLKIFKAPKGTFRGSWYALGPERPGSPASGDTTSSIQLRGRNVKFTLDQTLDTFSGVLSADGKSIAGTWTCCWGPQTPQPLTLNRVEKKTQWVIDPSPHKTRFVTVEKGVTLEVLDWGGNGSPLVFLAGLGNTAHEFDDLAPKFTDKHHIYAITRRGFGASSVPVATGLTYDADRLSDDVLAVMATLKIDRPVVAGHSVSGEELSSIGTRHPEKVAGLIYLDAITSARTFYAPGTDTFEVDINILRRELDRYPANGKLSDLRSNIDTILAVMPNVAIQLTQIHDQLQGLPDRQSPPDSPQQRAVRAVTSGERKYGSVTVPVLALVASPPACAPNCESAGAKAGAKLAADFTDAYQAGNPNAHVVRLAYANHQVWRSHESDVLREMNAFMDGLPAR